MNYVLVKKVTTELSSTNKLLRVLCDFARITCVFVSQIIIDNYVYFHYVTPYVTSLNHYMSSYGTHVLKTTFPYVTLPILQILLPTEVL